MKKIKILEAIRQGKVGGGESHVLELVTNLDKTRFEPVVLAFTDGPMVDELRNRGIKTKIIYTETGFDFRVWKKVRDFIKSEEIDIIHAHGTRANSNVFFAAKKLNLPLIYTVHGWSFHIDQNFHVRKLRELSENFLTSVADKTICVSKSNQEDGIKLFGMKRSEVIYNAVNLDKFNSNKQFKDIRNELGIPANKTLIGYIVRITGQKDPFTMIKAMKILSEKTDDAILLMVGEGDLKDATINLAKELNIEHKIIFQPFRSDIPDILNAIDIYCLPSLWEGFPIGILEAMAMGKVVIASPVDGTNELITDEETGVLSDVGDAELLAQNLYLMHSDSKFKNQIAAEAKYFVEKNFGIQRLIDRVENLYIETKMRSLPLGYQKSL
ncbi:MAG: glycosyltransferase family 4 protein [Bacteroidales bacterium]|nr:glycosyltransferase family 4 protein [Bacteroidales bacterium]MCF8391522.1 glycosyltransferase family 4 protein [Bacteroidales bacterium]